MGRGSSRVAPLEAELAKLQTEVQTLKAEAAASQRVYKTAQLVQRAANRESIHVKYYWIRADKLRATTSTTLPALQSLLDDPETRDWIIKKEMCLDDACRGKYVDEYSVVSHRWLTESAADSRRAPPDPKGVQLAAHAS